MAWKESDAKKLERLAALADAMSGGHLTIHKFTGDWAIDLGAGANFADGMDHRFAIYAMYHGDTFGEAADKLLAAFKAADNREERKAKEEREFHKDIDRVKLGLV